MELDEGWLWLSGSLLLVALWTNLDRRILCIISISWGRFVGEMLTQVW